MLDRLDLFEYLDIEDSTVSKQIAPAPKGRGRPPLKVKNPLDDIPLKQYVTSEGRPLVWLDDCLMGSIRAFSDKDNRTTSTSNYVGLNKVFKTLLYLRGDLTPKRVATALGVSHDTGWRIVNVINFAAFSINRELKNPTRIIAYTKRALTTTSTHTGKTNEQYPHY